MNATQPETIFEQIELLSLNDLIREVSKLIQETGLRWWFRGQDDASWDLLPSVCRGYTREQERFLSNEFYNKARTRHNRYPEDNDYAGWLSLMQHYGLPTRLLDWSNSPLVAAFFATLRSARHRPNDIPVDASIWALAPGPFNLAQSFEGYLYPLNAACLSDLLRPALKGDDTTRAIVAAWAVESDARMQVQQGAFTVHASDIPLNKIPGCKNWLRHFLIPANSIPTMARELEMMGVRLADLFPDLGHLAMELKAWHKP